MQFNDSEESFKLYNHQPWKRTIMCKISDLVESLRNRKKMSEICICHKNFKTWKMYNTNDVFLADDVSQVNVKCTADFQIYSIINGAIIRMKTAINRWRRPIDFIEGQGKLYIVRNWGGNSSIANIIFYFLWKF